jgi:uncharacterized protein
MSKFRKIFWFLLGMFFLGVAYLGVITPGIPWSTPSVIAAYCFSKSSKRWHDWIMNHRLFGPFLRNWSEKRIFPLYGKIFMIITMDISLIILWFTTHNWKLVLAIGLIMALVVIWATRFPTDETEYQRRKSAGIKIGWIK